MDEVSVQGLGNICEVEDVWYDAGLEELKTKNADFSQLNARNTAYSRLHLPTEHDMNQRGNWISEEIAFGIPGRNPIVIFGGGPVYLNAKKARKAHDEQVDFRIDDPALDLPFSEKTWADALLRLLQEDEEKNPMDRRVFELPENESFRMETEDMMRIDTNRLSDRSYFDSLHPYMQVAAMFFRDTVSDYAKEILRPSTIMNVLVMLPAKVESMHAQPMWLGSLSPGCGSCLVGCVCGNWMRGIRR